MDGTPYPPPTPSVPPPAPEPPQAPYQAPAPQYAPQAPFAPAPEPPKKKTGLIIGIVVAVILLCCCGSGVAGLLIFRASGDWIGESGDVIQQLEDLEDSASDIAADSGNPQGPAEGTGWEDFAPATYDPSVWIALEPFHEEVLADALRSLYPEFELAERLAQPSTEYSTDTVLARATLASDPEVAIAFWLEVENTPAFESGWVWDPKRDGYDYMDVATAANGREYSWDTTQLVALLNGITDDTTGELLVTVADDFPDAVITMVEADGETAYVEFTRWDAYPGYETGYSADYSYDGNGWVLDSAQEW